LVRFGAALPRLRAALRRDLRRPGLPRDKVLALIVRILLVAFLRPGSESYAARNGSYGLATLRRKHVRVRGQTLYFDFTGKSGKRQQRTLRDRCVAALVKRLIALPGYEVFKYLGDAGQLVDVKRADITEYIKRNMGSAFSAKDFRTWAGTLICACLLARRQRDDPPAHPSAVRRALAAAMRDTAEQLGNTPAVCRASYVNAIVPRAFASGRVIHPVAEDLAALRSQAISRRHECEAGLLALLDQSAPRRRARRARRPCGSAAVARPARAVNG
jgi:DNA topoisomerase-1